MFSVRRTAQGSRTHNLSAVGISFAIGIWKALKERGICSVARAFIISCSQWPLTALCAICLHALQKVLRATCDEEEFDFAVGSCAFPFKKQRGVVALTPAQYAETRPTRLRVLQKGLALTLQLEPVWGPPCRWLTLFRDPVTRLTSALFYCRRAPRDPLCGNRPKSWFRQARFRFARNNNRASFYFA